MFITTISIKNSQLADGGNPKYTLRHGLGWGITPRPYQGHIIKVKSPKKGHNIHFLLFLLQ